MKLIDWMKREGLDDDQVAMRHGECSAGAVKKWKYGERVPRPPQMRRLSIVTNQEVTANDFVQAADEAVLAS